MSSTPNLNQVHFRIRTDTATVDATPTWAAAEDTNVSLAVETTFRLRFCVNNTGTAASGTPTILRVSKNGGAYTAVTTSSGATLGAQSDGGASSDADEALLSTYRLTAGTGTSSSTGLYDETGSIGGGFNAGQYREYECGVILKTAGAAAGDTFDFRLYNNTTAFTTYAVTPRVTVPVNVNQTGFRFRQGTEVIGNPPIWYATENTAVTLPVETTFRIRFAVTNTGATAAGPQILRVSKNAGAYTAVTTSTGATLGAQSADASTSADEAALTTASFGLTAGTGTALQGVYDETGSATLSITSGFYTELEYGLILKTAGATVGDTFDFRVYNSASPYDTYTNTARVTCGTNSLAVQHFRIRTDTTAVASNTPTWAAAEDTNYYPGLETTFRLRLAIDNLSATGWYLGIELRVSKNGGAYNLVTTSSTDGLQSADASTTASSSSMGFSLFSLTAGTGTVDSGRYDETGSVSSTLVNIEGNRYTEYEFGLILKTANLTNGDVLTIRPYANSLPFNSYSVTPTITVSVVDTEDDLLANNVLSASSVQAGANLQQVHGILANDVASPSSVTQPAVKSLHGLLANDVTSASSVTTPAAVITSAPIALLANDVLSSSSVTNPAVKQLQGLLANDVKSNSSVTQPTAAITRVCLANDVLSASSVTQPAMVQRRDLLANDVKSNSSVGQPAAVIGRALLANDVLSTSSVSQPAAVIQRAILANDVTSASFVTNPIVGIVGTVQGRDIKSASSVTTPAVHQAQALDAVNVTSASSITTPAALIVRGLLANDVTSASSVSQPVAHQAQAFLANDVLSASSVTVPVASEITAGQPLAEDVTSASSVTQPSLVVISGEVLPPELGGAARPYGRVLTRKRWEDLLRQLEAERREARQRAERFKAKEDRAKARKAARAASEAIARAIKGADEAAVADHAAELTRLLEMAKEAKRVDEYMAEMAAVRREAIEMEDENDVEEILLLVA